MSAVLLRLASLMVMDHVIFTYSVNVSRQPAQDDGLCPPGFFLSAADNICAVCHYDTFTDQRNRERSCFPCYRDCREDLNMKVEAECTPTSDAKCGCKAGYSCKKHNSGGNCETCVQAPTEVPVTTPRSSCPPGMFYNVSSGRCINHTNCQSLGRSLLSAGNSTHDALCSSAHSPDASGVMWWHILIAVLSVITVTGVFIFIWKRGHASCLKQLLKISSGDAHKKEKQRPPLEGMKGFSPLSPSKPRSHYDLDCHLDIPASTEPTPQVTGNLGPFHIYSAGTVFVSLLNQVTGLDKGQEQERMMPKFGQDLRTAPPPSSPPIHLSEEEREAHTDYIFFPSQEQGKETQLSKEEGM